MKCRAGVNMSGRILIIGSLNMDMRIEVDAIPVVGETVLGNGLAYTPGGKGANQACAAGRIGEYAVMLGCIGNDASGFALKKNLESSGVITDYLKISDTEATGTAVILVNGEGNNSIVVCAGANNECNVEYLKENDRLFRECDYIVLQMEIPIESVEYAASRGRQLGKSVILNPAPAPDRIPDSVYSNIDFITPNETELMKLSGKKTLSDKSIREGAEILLGHGVRNVIVTLGDKGCRWISENEDIYIDAVKTNAVDTTAAGDCFNGAFAAGMAEGMSILHALRYANTASSITVTRKGAQEAIPGRDEVNKVFYSPDGA